MNTYLNESISNLLVKILSDKRLKSVMDKIEDDEDVKKAAQKLKSSTDELTPAIRKYLKKYPNSKMAKLLKSRGLI